MQFFLVTICFGLLFAIGGCKKSENISGSDVMSNPKTPSESDLYKWRSESDMVEIVIAETDTSYTGWVFEKNGPVAKQNCGKEGCDFQCSFGFEKSRSAGISEMQASMRFICEFPNESRESSFCEAEFFKTRTHGQLMSIQESTLNSSQPKQISSANSIPFDPKSFSKWLSDNYFKSCASKLGRGAIDLVTGSFQAKSGAKIDIASLVQKAIAAQVVAPK